MKWPVLAMCLLGILGVPAAALADPAADAKIYCQRVMSDNSLPASLRQKLILGRGDDGTFGLFGDGSMVTPEEAQALYDFRIALAPCRDAMLAALRATSSLLAAERERLFARNERILDDLMYRRISFGLANQRFSEAQMDYDLDVARASVGAAGYVQAGTLYGSGVIYAPPPPRVTAP